MIVSCKCLNIEVETKDEPVNFDKRLLGAGYNTRLFSKNLLSCEAISITKRQQFFVCEEKIHGWISYKCLNCDLLCYAESVNSDMTTILISSELLTDQKKIHELKNSDCYSPIYKMYINWSEDSNEIYSPQSSALLPPRIKILQRQMSECVEKETKLVEEKIRKFTENEYSALDEYRTKAQNDFHILSKKLYEKTNLLKIDDLSAQTSYNKTLSSSQKLPKPTITTLKNNPNMNLMDYTFNPYTQGNESDISPKSSRIKIPLGRGSNDSGLPPASYDAEGLFPLEDMDNLQIDCGSDDDLSESEGESGSHDEGIYIPHHKQLEMATSLPVDVPKFMINSGSVPNDVHPRVPIGREPENKTDIAASIRALAKSVHGDRIFGELPRPRLGSQI